jgi:hypothetical protein
MPSIEATGAPVACSRCGRPVPDGDAAAAWGSLLMNGRLVLVTCPDCLTPEERAQVGERSGASLYEVAGARRIDAVELALLVERAREAGRRAPARDWSADLPEGAVGVVAAEEEPGWLLVLLSGPGGAEGRRIAFLEVETQRWLAFEEVFVPAWVQERARELARGR